MIFSVSEANNFIKALLDAVPQLQTIFVRGEISNYKLYPSGHHYFTLKDEGSALKCVMFRGMAGKLRFRPENGMKVIACGRISVFPRDGAYQLYCTELTPDGVGVVCELKIITESVKVRIKKGDSFEIKEYPATDVQRLTPQNAPRPEAQRAEKPEQKQDAPEAAEIKEFLARPERPPRAERPMRPEKPMKAERQPEAPKPEKPAEAPKPAVSPWKMAVEQALRAAQNSADAADEVIEQPAQEAPVSEENVAVPEAAAHEAAETVVEESAEGAETTLSASAEAVEEAVEDAMEMPLIPLDDDDDTI